MRKIFSLLLVILLLFVTSCGEKETQKESIVPEAVTPIVTQSPAENLIEFQYGKICPSLFDEGDFESVIVVNSKEKWDEQKSKYDQLNASSVNSLLNTIVTIVTTDEQEQAKEEFMELFWPQIVEHIEMSTKAFWIGADTMFWNDHTILLVPAWQFPGGDYTIRANWNDEEHKIYVDILIEEKPFADAHVASTAVIAVNKEIVSEDDVIVNYKCILKRGIFLYSPR